MARRTGPRGPYKPRAPSPIRPTVITEGVTAPTTDYLRIVPMHHPTLGREYRWQLVDGQGVIRGLSQVGWLKPARARWNAAREAKRMGGLAVWGPPIGVQWRGVVVELVPETKGIKGARGGKGAAASPTTSAAPEDGGPPSDTQAGESPEA